MRDLGLVKLIVKSYFFETLQHPIILPFCYKKCVYSIEYICTSLRYNGLSIVKNHWANFIWDCARVLGHREY